MATELEPVEHYEKMNKVITTMLKGTINPYQIAREHNMKVVDVKAYIVEWQNYARNNTHIQDRARDAVMGADQHYAMILERLWETVEEADQTQNIRAKNTALKTVAEVERMRIDMLQKAGLLDDQHLAEQVIETERKQEILVNILREVANKHPEAASYIRKELGRVTGQVEGTIVAQREDVDIVD